MPGDPPAPESRRPLLIRAALLLAALAALAWRAQPDGNLHIIFPDVAGDAALIRAPAGGFVLVDGGSDPAALTDALGRAMPFWQRDLEAVVLTSPDAQRVPAQVAALARYRAAVAIAPPSDSRSATLAEWRRLLADQATPVRVARRGARLSIGGAAITVLAADGEGALLRVEYGRTCAILAHAPPDAAATPGRCDLLAFPWDLDPDAPLVHTVRPRQIVFTDGARSDDPPELTYAERAVGGASLYHEALDGRVEWVSDGRRAWISGE